MNSFFSGADFASAPFRALMPEYYPQEYQDYIAVETERIATLAQGSGRVLEAGVGIGRTIPILAPRVRELFGIDDAPLMLSEARKVASHHPNTTIVEGTLENLSTIFPGKHFDTSFCIWNTLGNVQNEQVVLQEIRKVTSGIICVTVYLKGTLLHRLNWYKTMDIEPQKVDVANEIFYSKSGLRSKSYSIADIHKLADASRLAVRHHEILNGLMLWVELTPT